MPTQSMLSGSNSWGSAEGATAALAVAGAAEADDGLSCIKTHIMIKHQVTNTKCRLALCLTNRLAILDVIFGKRCGSAR